jgi:hypothetical protein
MDSRTVGLQRSALALTAALGLTLATAPALAGPPKKVTADCSPGFYKKHPETWCASLGGPTTCPSDASRLTPTGEACTELVRMLSAELGATKAERDGAKVSLDRCFGTGSKSPCEDD